VRRFRVSRDENGDLVGEELDPAGAAMGPPVADAGPAGWVIVERSELASDRRALDWRGSRAQQERLNP
jgi:hypothetical protein